MASYRQLRSRSRSGHTRPGQVRSHVTQTAPRVAGATPVQLQRRLGNRGTQAWLAEQIPVQRIQMKEQQDEMYGRKAGEEEELLQGKFDPMQNQGPEEEEELLQGKFTANEAPAQFQGDQGKDQNRTGMSGPLKTGLEQLSGMDLSGVRVHKNSSEPVQLNAFAYTQGQDIHVAPGQEKHLPHEGWHAVQQKQGRVKPTMQAKGVSINDDTDLEREADAMGAMVLQRTSAEGASTRLDQHGFMPSYRGQVQTKSYQMSKAAPIQLASINDFNDPKNPNHDPGRVSDAAIKATDEFTVLLRDFTRIPMKYSEADVVLACRLAIRDIRQGKKVDLLSKGSKRPDEYMERAYRQRETEVGVSALKGKLEWVPFSSGLAASEPAKLQSEFAKWLLTAAKQPDPKSGKLNCWELVMYGAFKAGIVTEARLKAIYVKAVANVKSGKYFSVGLTFEEVTKASNPVTYLLGNKKSPLPLKGDIVVFKNAPTHACIATGRNILNKATGISSTEVVSLWVPSGRKVEVTTIESLANITAERPILFWSAKW